MTDKITPAFEDIRQATADILDAAIAANKAAKEVESENYPCRIPPGPGAQEVRLLPI